MLSLKEICEKKIANSIYNMPPQLQEMIICETKEQIRNQIREELKNEILEEKKARKEMLSTVIYLVPDIMKDIILSITRHNRQRKDFYQLWSHIPVETIHAAIQIAENAVNEMENRFVYRNFTTADVNNLSYNNDLYNEENEDYEDYEENEDY